MTMNRPISLVKKSFNLENIDALRHLCRNKVLSASIKTKITEWKETRRGSPGAFDGCRISWSYTFDCLTFGTSLSTLNLPEIENLAIFFSQTLDASGYKNLMAKYIDTKKRK